MTKMTKVLGLGMVAVIATSALVEAAGVSAYVDFASAYVFRGTTFNDGLVAQPGVDIATELGLEFGVWGNYDIDDMDGALAGSEFSEIDLWASYALPVDAFDLGLGYCEYLYPNAEAQADREVSVSVGKDVSGIGLGVDLYYGIDGGIKKSLYVEGGLSYTVPVTEEVGIDLGATAAFADIDGGESGFANYTFSAGTGYKLLSASVTYVGQGDDKVLTDDAYDVEVVGTVSIGTEF